MSIKCLLFLGCLLSAITTLPAAQSSTMYVAPNGKDSWSGHLPSPAADGQDGPKATLSAALARVRADRQSGTESAIRTIWMRGGRYQMDEPIKIGPADSEVTVAAYETEKPILSGGRRIGDARSGG